MTETPTTPTSPAPAPAKPQSGVRSFLTLVFRLLLLGIGGTTAALVGVAIATVYPDQSSEPPLVETVMRRSQEILRSVQGGATVPSGQAPVLPASPSATGSPSATSSPSATGSPTTTDSPTTTGSPTTTEPGAAPIVSASVSQTGSLTVTLPSDVLFTADQRTLRPEANQVLDIVVTDLQNYPDSEIRVAVYTDAQGDVAGDRNRTFSQAQSIKRYLADKLGDRYHWLVAGYGSQTPIAPNDTPLNRQRNRRIEITIQPRQ
ncbi:MAG TPA: OmpA family protein [Chroococcidiopsis sp.]